jgi:nicotinamide riboside transporter PnuC
MADTTETISDAMDYPQHEATYKGFMGMVKWGIIEMVLVVLALFCFIQAGQPWLGGLFLAASVVAPILAALAGPRR